MTLTKLVYIKTTLLLIISLGIVSCAFEDRSLESASWDLSDGIEFPSGRPLSRAEDGVILADGTLIVADQRYGLAKITVSGDVTPFGNFQALGYEHNPPEVESGPNGVHLTPDNQYVITADVFSGKIYKTSIEKNSTEIVYSHDYGVNTARQDSTGAIWFTQSTENKNEERVFAALGQLITDGALYRIPPAKNGIKLKPELVIDALNFANGFYIDEVKKKFYLSEMMSNRVLQFDIDLDSGSLSNQTTLAEIPTPDNMELNGDDRLWVASLLSNQVISINTETGESFVVFDAQTSAGLENLQKGLIAMNNGGGFTDLLTPELTGDMPGLLTGMIIGNENQPFYIANLGAALIEVTKD